jgi:uncharacterized protein (DUF2342 family)
MTTAAITLKKDTMLNAKRETLTKASRLKYKYMTTKNDKEVLIRTMREYIKEDGDLINELDQRLAETTSQRDEALERIDALIAEVEQWKRIAMDYAFDETE